MGQMSPRQGAALIVGLALLPAIVGSSLQSAAQTRRPAERVDRAEFAKTFRHRTVTVRGTRMHYVTGGSGRT